MSPKHSRNPIGPSHKDRRRGFRNVPAGRLRELRIAPRREGGVHDASVSPSREGIRAAIAAQMCPFCERGPFKMLPVHTNKIHGIDKWELREMAGYTTSDPISSEEARSAMSANHNPENLRKAHEALAKTGRGKGRWTTAGATKNRDSLLNWVHANPEAAQKSTEAALERTRSPEAVAKRAATLRERWAAMTVEERAAACVLNRPENRGKGTAANKAAASERPLPEHGDVNRYKHHGCRCDPCRAAKRLDRAKQKTVRSPAEDEGDW